MSSEKLAACRAASARLERAVGELQANLCTTQTALAYTQQVSRGLDQHRTATEDAQEEVGSKDSIAPMLHAQQWCCAVNHSAWLTPVAAAAGCCWLASCLLCVPRVPPTHAPVYAGGGQRTGRGRGAVAAGQGAGWAAAALLLAVEDWYA